MCDCNGSTMSGIGRRLGLSIINGSVPTNRGGDVSSFQPPLAAYQEPRLDAQLTSPNRSVGSAWFGSLQNGNVEEMPVLRRNFQGHATNGEITDSTNTVAANLPHVQATDDSRNWFSADETSAAPFADVLVQPIFGADVLIASETSNVNNGSHADENARSCTTLSEDSANILYNKITPSPMLDQVEDKSTSSGEQATPLSLDNLVMDSILIQQELRHEPSTDVVQQSSASESTNMDLTDDGYMDDLYGACAMAATDTPHQLCDELDAGLDDFIDADMPHNVRSSPVVGSPSNSSLSSLHDEHVPASPPAVVCDVDNISNRVDSSVPSTAATLNTSVDSDASRSSQLQAAVHFLEPVDRDAVSMNTSDVVALNSLPIASHKFETSSQSVTAAYSAVSRARFSNSASDCSFDTPPASLPSPNYDLFAGIIDASVASQESACLTAISDDDTFDDDIGRHWPNHSETALDGGSSSGSAAACSQRRRNEYFWLPISQNPVVESPAFGCWSCFDAVDSFNKPNVPHRQSDWLSRRPSEAHAVTVMFNSSCRVGCNTDRYVPSDGNAVQNGVRRPGSVNDVGAGCGCDSVVCQHSIMASSLMSSHMSTSLTLDDLRVREDSQHTELSTSSVSANGSLFCASQSPTNLRPCEMTNCFSRPDTVETYNHVSSPVSPVSSVCNSSLDPTKSSACSTVSVIRVLQLLGIERGHRDIGEMMHANRCAFDKLPLCEFLKAHSQTGMPAEQIITGVSRITSNRVYGKFFSFCQRHHQVGLSCWLTTWMKLGAVPLATLKFESRSLIDNFVIGDSWQHMTIYNVLPSGIVIGDSQSIVSECELENQLATAESTVRVPRVDIVTRWRDECDLGVLAVNPDQRWGELNVLGQVINILRESRLPPCTGCRPQITSHLTLPTHYNSGITLFAVAHSPAYAILHNEESPELAMTTLSSPSGSSLLDAAGASRTSAELQLRAEKKTMSSKSSRKRFSAV